MLSCSFITTVNSLLLSSRIRTQLVKKALKANRNFMDAFLVMSSMYGYHHKSADNYDVARCAAIVSRAHDLFDSSHPGLYGSLHTSRKASHQAAHSPQKYAKTYREYTRRDRNNSSASSSASASAAKYRTHSDSSPYSFRAPGMKRGVMDDAAGANSARPPTRPPPAHLRSGKVLTGAAGRKQG